MSDPSPLARYRAKRDFARSPEPRGARARTDGCRFVVQQHAARRMHYDVRLELDGVLKSWAVPKGPSLRAHERRLAVQVEDHPVAYATFEGVIPAGVYGGGQVIVWDEGAWSPVGDARAQLRRGHLKFVLAGHKLRGGWSLVRTGDAAKGTNWLLVKADDVYADDAVDITTSAPESLYSGRTVHEVDGPPGGGASRGVRPKRTQGPGAVRPRGPTPAARAAKTARARASAALAPASPDAFAVQLATLVDEIPSAGRWSFEVKLDGYRAVVLRDGARVLVRTRNGHDWTARFANIAAAARRLPVTQAVLDGEVVALDADGRSDFGALQRALQDGDDGALVYCAFDLLWLRGVDLRPQPQAARKRALAALLAAAPNNGPLRYWTHLHGRAAGARALAAAEKTGLEGLVGKRSDAPYRAGRGDAWVKLKCVQRQEFVVGGYVGAEPSTPRALLLGVFGANGGALRFVGRVASGLDRHLKRALAPALRKRPRRLDAFDDAPQGGQICLVRPTAVVEVRFGAWTDAGRLRHAVLLGLRADRPASEVVRERGARAVAQDAGHVERPANTRRPRTPGVVKKRPTGRGDENEQAPPTQPRAARRAVRLTHPDRPVAPGSPVTKAELVAYFAQVAPYMLAWVGGRPLSVLRCPDGALERAFFHKHLDASAPGLRAVTIDARPYAYVSAASGLAALAQASGLELHPWGSRAANVEAVDTLVFDLDPGDGVRPTELVRAAIETRDLLQSLGLRSLLKATGGAGLHVVVPGITDCDWRHAKAVAQLVADYLVARAPTRFTASVRKAARRGKIFVDYLRNGRGATAIGVYSPRARVGLPVARPVAWADLAAKTIDEPWDVPRLRGALRRGYVDPWAAARRWRQTLGPALRAQALEVAAGRKR